MATYTFEQKRDIIVKNPNQELVFKGRKARKKLLLHTHGVGLKDAIKKEDYFENADIYKSRHDLAISNKDMLMRTLQEEEQVFTARGGSNDYAGLSDEQETQVNQLLGNLVWGISLRQWVQQFGLQAYRNDPMGIIFMEVEQLLQTDGVNIDVPKCYPTYKSSESIYDYQPNGRCLEYVCFQLSVKELLEFGINDPDFTMFPENGRIKPKDKQTPYYRFVDDAMDIIVKRDNETITIVTNTVQPNPIKNEWGRVPAFIVSDLIQFDDPECFASPLGFVVELCDCFLNDRSIRDLQKKYHGFAKAVEPMLKCSTCGGEGEVKGSACPDCTPPGHNHGTGYKLRTKVSEVSKFPIEIFETIPRFNFKDIFGYVTPDIESWKQQDLSLDQLEQLIYFTYWGVGRMLGGPAAPSQPGKMGDKTAYEVRANLKPKYARLNSTADWAEKTENMIADLVGQFWIESYREGDSGICYGRNYILETPADLRQQYFDLRLNGAPDFLLDEAMERYLQAEYESNQMQLAKYTKLLRVEPFPHLELVDAKAIIPLDEDYNAKVYFGEWYDTLEDVYIIDTPVEKLRQDLQAYVKAKNIPPPPVAVPGAPGPGEKEEQMAQGAAVKKDVKTEAAES
jgi:hypothetical protein